jgi:PBP1b-binding outer membrane lipoprotein LpoB
MPASCAVAACVAAVLLLGGCSSEDTAGASAAGPKSEASATPGSEGSFDVEAALEKADSAS